jgi:effector-binding domain-containing protein
MRSFLKSNKLFIAIIIVVLAVAGAAFIPVTEKDYIVINAPMNNIMNSVQQVGNWKKWHPDLKSNDSAKIDVITITPFGILVKQTENQNESLYSLVVQPSDAPNTSAVEIRFRTNLLRLLFDELKNLGPGSLNPLLKSLRQYLETPKLFYGFPMEFTKITDTLVLTTTSESAVADVTDSLRAMFHRLRSFVEQNSIPITDSPIAYIQRIQAPRKKLMAAIPVAKKTAPGGLLEFLHMPDGRMLTVEYNGDYRNIQSAYIAADRYINDYNLKPVALPYERYYTHAVSAADSTRMKIRIYIPVL